MVCIEFREELYTWPNSGYTTRQISFLLNNYVYREGEDTENLGLLIPRYRAVGRVNALTGKRYPTCTRQSEDELVPVRSILTKSKGDLNVITPDLIGTHFHDFTEGAGIGVSFASSLTEGTTQSALSLKHGRIKIMTAMYKMVLNAGTFNEKNQQLV